MDNRINLNYFQGLLHLPYANIQSVSTQSSGKAIDIQQAQLERYISIYQKEYLTLMFGSDVIPAEVEELIADDVLFVSPIANYVFCKVLPFYASRSTIVGEKIKKGETSQNTEYSDKAYQVWNQMVYMNEIIRKTLDDAGLDKTYPTDYNERIYKVQSFIW